MTNADEVAEITAERFGQPTGERLRAIAAIHALADFLRDNPDVPTPYSVTAYSTVADSSLLDYVAARFGARTYGDDDRRQADLLGDNGVTQFFVTHDARKAAGL